MSDKYYGQDDVSSSARKMFVITPHATNPIAPIPKAVRFDAAGAVVLRTIDADEDVTINVTAGETLVARVEFVRVSGTDVAANSIHGLA